MNDNRKEDERRAAEAARVDCERKQEPQPKKKQDEQFDDLALDDVLRDCPL